MRKLMAVLAIISATVLPLAAPPAAQASSHIPAGCPGGPAGPPASGTTCPGDVDFDCPEGTTKVSVRVNGSNCVSGIYAYLNNIIRVVEGLIGVGIVVAIVVSGIQYITSAGNPDGIKGAKKRLGNAILGLVLYLLLVTIIEWLGIGIILK